MFNWSSFYLWKSFHLTNRLHLLYTTNIVVSQSQPFIDRVYSTCSFLLFFFLLLVIIALFFFFNNCTYIWVSFSLNVLCVSASIKKREILIRWPVARVSAWVRACMYGCVCKYIGVQKISAGKRKFLTLYSKGDV